MIRNEIKLNFSGDKFERTFQNYHSVQVRIVTIWILEAIKKIMLRRDSHSITEENDHQKGQRLLTPLHEPTFQVQ